MQLLIIDENGNVKEFDSIPVWMHGNILADRKSNKSIARHMRKCMRRDNFSMVKIHTYSVSGNEKTRVNEETLADDRIIPWEANPRVGADIDEDGNIAVAFSNYQGDTQELLYRNNSVCNVPFLYVNRSSERGGIDIMLISRDERYWENCDTQYIRLNIA